ncbi:MAG: NAD(P)(+) transhydrogenase (Re/Si-specific) subunit beta, partial [Planctomycetia bacterium]
MAACFESPVTERIASHGPGALVLLGIGGIVGGVIGGLMALKYPMTGMPQMVALLNGFGGAASALVAGAELWNASAAAKATDTPLPPWTQFAIATALTGLIGAVTFWGSFVAFAKLEELPRFKQAW